MRIAILDPCIQATGLKTVIPESDYYIISSNGKYDLNKTPDIFMNQYGFSYNENINNINSLTYDILIIVYCVKDLNEYDKRDYIKVHKDAIINILSKNNFKTLIIVDNDDYNNDPVLEFPYINADIWLKRYYSSKVSYNKKVKPFPFVIFGHICPLWKVLNLNYNIAMENKLDRILWGGYKAGKQGDEDYLPRDYIIDKLDNNLTIISASNDIYIQELSKSKFCLDLNGLGDPNIRTFEILSSNSLLIQQYKNLVWPFDSGDAFSEETIFKTPEECLAKITALRADNNLYNKCLNNQLYIKGKYFTRDWLRSYIMSDILTNHLVT